MKRLLFIAPLIALLTGCPTSGGLDVSQSQLVGTWSLRQVIVTDLGTGQAATIPDAFSQTTFRSDGTFEERNWGTWGGVNPSGSTVTVHGHWSIPSAGRLRQTYDDVEPVSTQDQTYQLGGGLLIVTYDITQNGQRLRFISTYERVS